MPTSDKLRTRMLLYESLSGSKNLITPGLPALARLSGVGFRALTEDLNTPYDHDFSDLMVATTSHLVKATNARLGYCHSAEITLLWKADDAKQNIYRGGRHHKMISITASTATAFFVSRLATYLPTKVGFLPTFDCRVWTVPSDLEAINCFICREQYAIQNSILSYARANLPHSDLVSKKTETVLKMLSDSGIVWESYPTHFRRGTYMQRRYVRRPFFSHEIEKLPPNHEARSNPNLIEKHIEVVKVNMPPLASVTNKLDVVFNGADPTVSSL